MNRFLLTLLLTALSLPSHAERNIILFIGDGMDDHQITIARNYLHGANGRLLLDSMALRSVSQVLTVDENGKQIYVADSANSATAIATGVVTSRGRIATTAGSDQPIPTLLDMVEEAGMKSGLVSTASVTDATPASFVAHINVRTCENPETMPGIKRFGFLLPDCKQWMKANGGPGSISEQIAASDVDVVLGGGRKHFDMPAEGDSRTVRELAEANGYTVIDDAEDLATAEGEKLLGLFSPSTMPVRMRAEGDRTARRPTPSWLNEVHPYIGSVKLPDPVSCEYNPAFDGMPGIAEMTSAALQRLQGENGFFLMVEPASIDKQSHERRPCGSISELEQLEEALAVALKFAEENPETLILITADHGHAAQLVPATSLFAAYGAPVYTPGRLERLMTDEGAILAINYATNSFPYEEHTGTHVPLYANEPGVGRVPTMVTQPQIYEIMRDYLFGEDGGDDE